MEVCLTNSLKFAEPVHANVVKLPNILAKQILRCLHDKCMHEMVNVLQVILEAIPKIYSFIMDKVKVEFVEDSP